MKITLPHIIVGIGIFLFVAIAIDILEHKEIEYNFVSFISSEGHSNTFFKSTPSLDIRDAEKQLKMEMGVSELIILNFVEVSKYQYEQSYNINPKKL